MRNRFDQQLHHLDEQLTHMGELCEIAISKVTQALKEGSAGQARIVVAEDEEIDQMEKEIEPTRKDCSEFPKRNSKPGN